MSGVLLFFVLTPLLLGLVNTFGIAFNGSRWPFRLGFALHRFFVDWPRYSDEVWFSTMDDDRQQRMRERYPGRFDFIKPSRGEAER